MKYRPEIDGLRAIAVLPVVLFHAGAAGFGGGFVGVDIFFVISGYLITTIILDGSADKKFDFTGFYQRRARRLLPALFCVMLVCLPLAYTWLTPIHLKDFGQSLIATSVLSSNVLFWMESGYFDSAADLKPMLHTWSIAVEVEFYLLFPILFLALWRLGLRSALFWLSILFVVSLGLHYWGRVNYPHTTFYFLPTRIWEFLLGTFAAIYLSFGKKNRTTPINQFLSLLGFGLILFSIITFDETAPLSRLYQLMPVLGAALIIVFAMPGTWVYKLLSIPPLVGLGLISYSFYLWHYPLMAFTRHQVSGEISTLLMLALILLSVVLAIISWRYIENPH